MPSTVAEQDAPASRKRLHVAVGVIVNARQEVLIARRAMDAHQGGLWEFPGGKVEAGESVQQALARELKEELSITLRTYIPWIKVAYDYPDKSVLLDVWRVESFEGVPQGLQGQPLRWVMASELLNLDFPAANRPIITSLCLAREMLVTGAWRDEAEFCRRLQAAMDKGIRLVQLRAHQCDESQFSHYCNLASNLCRPYGARLIANTSTQHWHQLPADGLHLTSQRLLSLQQRPLPLNFLLGASCHNETEIRHAGRIGVDYITLGPVYPTATHPRMANLGVEQFGGLIKSVSVPVFALGGMDAANSQPLLDAGAFGVAAIRQWW